MINKEQFILLGKRWSVERNLTRLTYRTIYFNDMMLSFEQISNAVYMIRYTKSEREILKELERIEIEKFKEDYIKKLEAEGCTDIEIDGYDCIFSKDGKSYFTSLIESIADIELYHKNNRNRDIKDALETLIEIGWIEKYEDITFYGNGKVKSKTIRYKNLKSNVRM